MKVTAIASVFTSKIVHSRAHPSNESGNERPTQFDSMNLTIYKSESRMIHTFHIERLTPFKAMHLNNCMVMGYCG